MAKVAVSNTLSNVSQLLSNNGYDVIPFQQVIPQEKCDAVILSGESENMMGIMDIEMDCPVINAGGMTAEEVLEQLQNRIPQQ